MFQHIDDSTPIWRYMDFDKLVANLFPSSVMFSSLRLMSDHTEGRWYQYPGTTEPSIYREVVDRTFVMCWTLNEPSSGKVWSEYTKPSKGIALATTFGKLKREYHYTRAGPLVMVVGKVQYTDYPITLNPSSSVETVSQDIVGIATTKSSRFEWENEVRAIAAQTVEDAPWECVIGTMDIFDLVDDVVICPDAEPWLGGALERVLKYRAKAPQNHMYASVLKQ